MKFEFDKNRYIITVTADEIIFEEKRMGSQSVKINEIMSIGHSYSSFAGFETMTLVTSKGVKTWKLQVFKKGHDAKLFLECFNYIKNLVENNAKEIRKKCRVCGKIFCYDSKDIIKNDNNTKTMMRSSIGSVGSLLVATRYDAYELNKISKNASDSIVDYSKCPNCGSTDLKDVTDSSRMNTTTSNPTEEIKKYKELLDIGAITEEEYDKKKKELLNL